MVYTATFSCLALTTSGFTSLPPCAILKPVSWMFLLESKRQNVTSLLKALQNFQSHWMESGLQCGQRALRSPVASTFCGLLSSTFFLHMPLWPLWCPGWFQQQNPVLLHDFQCSSQRNTYYAARWFTAGQVLP